MDRIVSITVNGKRESAAAGTSIGGYLASKGIDPAVTVVEVNEKIVKKEKYGAVSMKEGDRVEVLRFVGGG